MVKASLVAPRTPSLKTYWTFIIIIMEKIDFGHNRLGIPSRCLTEASTLPIIGWLHLNIEYGTRLESGFYLPEGRHELSQGCDQWVVPWGQFEWYKDNWGWLANSPDLRQIEECWFFMQERVVKMEPTSVHNHRFGKVLKMAWADIGLAVLQVLYLSMQNWFKGVIHAIGGNSNGHN